ncbi:MAG: 2-oxoacid:ferredoxin oxidoreductase subunit beta [bacterium]|nr:2-oxoacid:ferredoxin oxidoreductase subunit beta [bacterium]
MNAESKYTKKDFVPPGDVKWCAGCGDYAILAQVQKVLAETGISPDQFAFISGIGCSSRFPYYMNCYGLHGIHGRALAIATGTKVANPDLHVWVAMGDGDGLAIGGNHFIHAVRRNVGIKSILMDNRIYGLTKGQFSPTSQRGAKVKTAPMGTVEDPIDPISLSLSLGGSFVARTTDRDVKHMAEVLRRSQEHDGFSMVQVLQNCPIFNDGAFDTWVSKGKEEYVLKLVHGEKMIFGLDNEKCIVRNGFSPKVALVAEVDEKDIIIHDEFATDSGLAGFLSQLNGTNGMPMALGIFRQIDHPAFEAEYRRQNAEAAATKGKGDLATMLHEGETWTL